jgi:hypothetical protein
MTSRAVDHARRGNDWMLQARIDDRMVIGVRGGYSWRRLLGAASWLSSWRAC